MKNVPVKYYKHLEYFSKPRYNRAGGHIRLDVIKSFYDAGWITKNDLLGYTANLTEAGRTVMMKFDLLK